MDSSDADKIISEYVNGTNINHVQAINGIIINTILIAAIELVDGISVRIVRYTKKITEDMAITRGINISKIVIEVII